MPTLIHAVNDLNKVVWRISNQSGWVTDPTFYLRCISEDTTVYLSISGFASSLLSGFYVQIGSNITSPTFSKIKSNDNERTIYLFKRNNLWILGEECDVDNGLGFVVDAANLPSQITSTDWRYSSRNDWHQLPTKIYAGNPQLNVYAVLRNARTMTSIPSPQKFFQLRNGGTMPAVGLGTGGIPTDISREVFLRTYQEGYRMYDLAREYKNEEIMGSLLLNEIPRNDIFLTTKVWPTHLGYQETFAEIIRSLSSLQTLYIDQYLLHWPACIPSVEWMHCQDVINPNGTWRESWRALERAYSEGMVQSIGVSNFDLALLEELDEFSLITPHAVQNYAHITLHDVQVRIWCSVHETVFIPYATGRDLSPISPELMNKLKVIADRDEISIHAVILRYFLTSGTAIIPRSTNLKHLQENIHIVPSTKLSEEDMVSLGWTFGSHRQEL